MKTWFVWSCSMWTERELNISTSSSTSLLRFTRGLNSTKKVYFIWRICSRNPLSSLKLYTTCAFIMPSSFSVSKRRATSWKDISAIVSLIKDLFILFIFASVPNRKQGVLRMWWKSWTIDLWIWLPITIWGFI